MSGPRRGKGGTFSRDPKDPLAFQPQPRKPIDMALLVLIGLLGMLVGAGVAGEHIMGICR